jgi:O-acetyl-ADP-ribose deacetylase (regulator of RNase III)
MPFTIIRDDITRVKADAIVNTANPLPIYASGTDQKIYEAAGAERLLAERQKIGVIAPGQAAYTAGFDLPVRYIIHTVGPLWIDGSHQEEETLASCLRESLKLAEKLNCLSVAFPLISTGVYGFPKQLALKIFTSVIYDWLMESDMLVTLVVYDQQSFDISTKLFGSIEDHLTESEVFPYDDVSFEQAVKPSEESFHDYLWQLILASDMTNPQIYHRANITKQHFSKIVSNRDYLPSKNTICALAIALKLDIEMLKLLLEKAGYSLSKAKEFDNAVRYFVEREMYNIIDDNIILFDNHLELLGTM